MMKTRSFKNLLRLSKLAPLLLATILLFTAMNPVTAQGAGNIDVAPVDTSAFPQVTTSFRAFDAGGDFIRNIRPGELRVLENNATLPEYELELVHTGVRFFVAFNEGPTLANRFSGVSRFDRLKTALFNWIATQPPDGSDEMTLVSNQGILEMDSGDPASWQTALEAYQPDLRNMTPGMSSLSIAVDNAMNLNLQGEKSSAILYITPMPTETQFVSLQEIIARAESNDIRVFIWLIGPPDYAATDEALLLQQYAEESGGRFFLFSGAEELPELADWLDPLAYLYRLSYTTKASVSGNYELVLRIQRGDLSLESAPVSYSFLIAPPNPIFLSPPVEITRTWTETRKKSDSVLVPDSTTVDFIVEFPDGMERDLVVSRLFVDGKLAAENTAAPFSPLAWDLSGYTETATHNLQIMIEDIVGLKGQTIEIPVQVTIEEQKLNLWERVLDLVNPVYLIVGAIVLAVVIAGVIVLIRVARRKLPRRKVGQTNDPVTQPVSIEGSYILAPEKPDQVVKWPVIRGLGLAPARLLQKKSSSPEGVEYLLEIPIGNNELVIGSDRKKADYVLVHPSVSARHARIFKDAEGGYRIADAGSVAGTWVNYAPVSTRGVRLEHGDLVQFGRLAYIFEVHGAEPKRVQVLPYKED